MSFLQDSALDPSKHPHTSNISKDYYTTDYSIDMPPVYEAEEIEMPVLNQPAAEGEDGGNDAVIQREDAPPNNADPQPQDPPFSPLDWFLLFSSLIMVSFLIIPQAIIYEYWGYEHIYNACESENLWLRYIDKSFSTTVPGFYLSIFAYLIAIIRPQCRTLQYAIRHFFFFILGTLIAHLLTIRTGSDHFCLTLSYAMGRGDFMKGRYWNRPWLHDNVTVDNVTSS